MKIKFPLTNNFTKNIIFTGMYICKYFNEYFYLIVIQQLINLLNNQISNTLHSNIQIHLHMRSISVLSWASSKLARLTPFWLMMVDLSNIVFWRSFWWRYSIDNTCDDNRKENFHCIHLRLVNIWVHVLFTETALGSKYFNVVA